MGSPFIAEIRLFGGNFAPTGWSFCNGQLMAISQNEALFSLIGTTYGGDGVTTYQIPDLQGRVPVHQGPGFIIGQKSGSENVTLTTGQLPQHSHSPVGATVASSRIPTGKYWSTDPDGNVAAYNTASSGGTMGPSAIGAAGSDLPHENMQPFLAITYIISLFGIFPSQS